MYLNLIKPLKRKDQVMIESNLTEERERCEIAIKLAEEGIKVALISSGDSGIYGMSGLLLELIQKVNKAFRPVFEVHQGISSMQLAAGQGSKLLKEKKIFKSVDSSKSTFGAVTIAASESKNQYSPLTGEIHVVGSGPGDISYLTCLLYTSPSPRD